MIELADKIFNWFIVPSNIVLSIIVIAAFPRLVCLVTELFYNSNDDEDIEESTLDK